MTIVARYGAIFPCTCDWAPSPICSRDSSAEAAARITTMAPLLAAQKVSNAFFGTTDNGFATADEHGPLHEFRMLE